MRSIVALAQTVLCGLLVVAPAFAQDYSSTNTARVSKGTFSGAVESNAASINARTSRNGRFVVFESTATNLVTPATSGRRQVYLFDRQANSTELVSLTSLGAEVPTTASSPTVSGDGRYVAFTSDATVSSMVSVCLFDVCHINKAFGGTHVYVRDRLANDTFMIDQVTMPVQRQQIINNVPQVVTDELGHKIPLLETVTKRVAATIVGGGTSVSSNPRMSQDGKFVVYDTDADNLVLSPIDPVFIFPSPGGAPDQYNSSTGVMNDLSTIFIPVGFYADGNNVKDVYVRDGSSFSNNLLSLSCKFHEPNHCGIQGTSPSTNPSISDDGSLVTFMSDTPFLDLDFNGTTDVYLLSRSLTGEVASLIRVSNNKTKIVAANGASKFPAISANGRFIAFQSDATDIVAGDTNAKTDIFVYDRTFNKTIRCSTGTSGAEGDGDSTLPDITGDGRYVSFQSTSANFGATSGTTNVYVGKIAVATGGAIASCALTLGSPATGTGGNGNSTGVTVGLVPQTTSVNGKATITLAASVVYQSTATNVSNSTDSNGVSDIFQSPLCTTTQLTTDTDGDGTVDCFDQCPNDQTKVEDTDVDGDGIPDCEDGCATDPQKGLAGACGCGVSDVDTDSDGIADCKDLCPSDPAKVAPGTCGCGHPDSDANNNGTIDCVESTSPNATPTPNASATRTPGATPTPTVDISAVVPPAPHVAAAGRGKIEITFAIADYAAITDHLAVTFTKLASTPGGKTQTIRRNTIGGVLTGFKAGKYRAKYKIVTTAGKSSLFSPSSGTVRVK